MKVRVAICKEKGHRFLTRCTWMNPDGMKHMTERCPMCNSPWRMNYVIDERDVRGGLA